MHLEAVLLESRLRPPERGRSGDGELSRKEGMVLNRDRAVLVEPVREVESGEIPSNRNYHDKVL